MPSQLTASNRVIIGLLTVAFICAAGYALQHTVSCFLLSFVLAYLLDPAVVSLERKKVRRSYGILLLYLVVILISVFCFIYLFPFITLAWESLVRDLRVLE